MIPKSKTLENNPRTDWEENSYALKSKKDSLLSSVTTENAFWLIGVSLQNFPNISYQNKKNSETVLTTIQIDIFTAIPNIII
jgi:hypothetical protein